MADTPSSSSATTTTSTLQGSSRKRHRHYSEEMWPKRKALTMANIIHAPSINAWNSVEYVIVGGQRLPYLECRNSTLNITLSSNLLELYDSLGTKYNVPCLASELHDKSYYKAKVLIDAASKLPKLKDQEYKITLRNIPGNDGGDGSDSDDEPVPYPRDEGAFTEKQLVLVQFCFDNLRIAFKSARSVGFVNCCGKNFFEKLCLYTNRSCVNECEHLYLLNTSKGNAQPGAFFVKWAVKERLLRSNSGTKFVEISKERYADGVAYNTQTLLYEIVSEIKEDNVQEGEDTPTTAEAQHNEQMIGLWRPRQQTMLGLEFYTDFVVPKVLLLDGNQLLMFYLKKLDFANSCDVSTLINLVIAFTVFSQCYKPLTMSQ